METSIGFIIPGACFALTLGFGFWLSRSGKPYNGLIFNIHKLAALAAVIVAVIRLAQMLGSAGPLAPVIIALLVLAGLCVAALFASGALMSAGKLDQALMRLIHRIALGMLIIVAIVLILQWSA